MIRLITIGFVLLMAASGMHAQVLSADQIILLDKTTNKSIILQEPSGLTSGVRLNLPATASSTGQGLVVSSTSGSTVNLGWQTATTGFSSLANRLSATVTTNSDGTPATKLSVTVAANKMYRIQGILICGRTTSGDITFTMDVPTNSTLVRAGLHCYDCNVASSTGLPATTTVTSANQLTLTFNPGGTSDHYAFQIDGFMEVGSSSGTLYVYAKGNGGSGYNTVMQLDSFIVLTELN